ncbi:FGGY carbohydrate kinase domain-containing protein isoform X2 [Tachypleus tridentatus]|uniref:FGGY carbohydrate kinase domain-containing protein isoform X2 n=1 Tax=Tachypleus tridentatus TaxID=6853 RepID=UPI003FD2C08A
MNYVCREQCVIAIDVGTRSVRGALVTVKGKVLCVESHPIQIWSPEADSYEQSSDDIWDACCIVIKKLTCGFKIHPDDVVGVGFDATCSLVVLDKNFEPLTVSSTGRKCQNVIMWMDHRAAFQADFINKTEHMVLRSMGGKVSLEMQPPKLMWIKQNLPQTWENAGYFFDLPDFLTWRATGSLSRSLCTVTCKWLFQADDSGAMFWDQTFWKQIGMLEITEENFKKIGNIILAPGQPCGKGLTEDAAIELELKAGTPVATSIVDAHAGGIGLLGCSPAGYKSPVLTKRLALICGTSTCHMKVTEKPLYTPGVWGPYFSAMIPSLWLNEGGQSAAGSLVDHIICTHPAARFFQDKSKTRHIQEILNDHLELLAIERGVPSVSFLTTDLHMWPDFHGNRSPLADSTLKGMYGTRHIIENLEMAGHEVEMLFMCGGLAKNKVYVQMHADATGLPVLVPDEPESVLLGGAVLAATVASVYKDVSEATSHMCGEGTVVLPQLKDKSFHDSKYEVFLKLLTCQKECREIMQEMF